jgi:predicted nucleotidyltransferase
MKKVPEKYKALIDDFIDLVKGSFGDNIASAVLYGSVAKGRARKESDIDVCLVFKSLPQSRHKRTLLIHPLIKKLREKKSYTELFNEGYIPEPSPILYTIEEIQDTKPIFLDMVEDGIVLFDDGTVTNKLEELKKKMEILGSKKVALDNGDYYWILKPGLRLTEEVTI